MSDDHVPVGQLLLGTPSLSFTQAAFRIPVYYGARLGVFALLLLNTRF